MIGRDLSEYGKPRYGEKIQRVFRESISPLPHVGAPWSIERQKGKVIDAFSTDGKNGYITVELAEPLKRRKPAPPRKQEEEKKVYKSVKDLHPIFIQQCRWQHWWTEKREGKGRILSELPEGITEQEILD